MQLNSAKDAYTASLAGASSQTRVHAVCLALAPAAGDVFDTTLRYSATVDPVNQQPPLVSSAYYSRRTLSDEQRYVLDRRALPSRLGNMLKRPGLLLHPEEIGETSAKKEKLEAGSGYQGANAARMCESMAAPCMGRSRQGLRLGGRGQAVMAASCNLDWLAVPARVAANLRPDGNGCVTIPLEAINAQRGGW